MIEEEVAEVSITVVTTTWNSGDHLDLFLSHYQKLGIDHVFVMDYSSDDETPDILHSSRWAGFVSLCPFPGLDNLDSSNIMLKIAQTQTESFEWCLFCDPDELLVTPSMSVSDLHCALKSAGTEFTVIPRFNVTARQGDIDGMDEGLGALRALNLRIDQRASRAPLTDIYVDKLSPPWIYTDVPGKVLLKLRTAISIGPGDHSAVTDTGASSLLSPGYYFLHFPFRKYPRFENKVYRARIQLKDLPEWHSWQYRRWIRLADAGMLYDEYVEQFVQDKKLDYLISKGVMTTDDSIRNFHEA